MSDILSVDFTRLSSSLSEEEITLLQQYQKLALNLTMVKAKLGQINEQISSVSEENVQSISKLIIELQATMGTLGTSYKSTVHNVLLSGDSNQLVNRGVDTRKYDDSNQIQETENFETAEMQLQQEGNREGGSRDHINTNNGHNNEQNLNDVDVDVDVDVDLDSGIDEETMNAVDRIQHELGISADDVDIHRQIADQLEIQNSEDY